MAPERATWTNNLPGPLLTEDLRRQSVDAIIVDLVLRAASRPITDPATWMSVAADLGILVHPFTSETRESLGCLTYLRRQDQWVIEINAWFSRLRQARVLVHEMAHWYQRSSEPAWLCGHPGHGGAVPDIVYHYAGPVSDARHQIARTVERRLFGLE